MAEQSFTIACIGECMIEIATLPGMEGLARLGFGGDTLNTAIYLSRMTQTKNIDVSYVTTLGDDPYAASMLKKWHEEELDCSLVNIMPNRETGLYAISLDQNGERSFKYWRSNAPACQMFSGPHAMEKLKKLKQFDAIYYSAITLAILDQNGRDQLLELAQTLKSSGKQVIFDSNYRERLWSGKCKHTAYQRALKSCTILLPSIEDLNGAFECQPNDWKAFMQACNIDQIVLKNSGNSLEVFHDQKWHTHHLQGIANPVDTTAAGDSFNAGYIAAILSSQSPQDAAIKGHELAMRVIGFPGAIIPRTEMEDLMKGTKNA